MYYFLLVFFLLLCHASLTFFLVQWLEIHNKAVNIKFISLSVRFVLTKYEVRISVSLIVLIWHILFIKCLLFTVVKVFWDLDKMGCGFDTKFSNKSNCDVVNILPAWLYLLFIWFVS